MPVTRRGFLSALLLAPAVARLKGEPEVTSGYVQVMDEDTGPFAMVYPRGPWQVTYVSPADWERVIPLQDERNALLSQAVDARRRR